MTGYNSIVICWLTFYFMMMVTEEEGKPLAVAVRPTLPNR